MPLVRMVFMVAMISSTTNGARPREGSSSIRTVGRAIMAKPKLMLLDEPSLGLAPLIVDQIFETILKINQAEGCTIFLVEQNARVALSISQWGYIMEVGELVMQDESEKLQKNEEVKKAYLGGE